ncbi:MAG: response regulator [Candidatus Nanoarchaeia archaeon]
MVDEIVVGMGRLYVVNEPVTLTCIGLGSCIGLMVYDRQKGIAGLAHIMLPDSSNAKFTPVEQSSLLAENDDYSLKTITNSLENKGYEIKYVAKNVDDAVEKFKEINPYLLLLDFKLAGEDTCSLVSELFNLNSMANIVVANTDKNYSYLDILSNGAIDVIPKPLTKDKLELTLDIVTSLRYLRFADVAIEKMLNKMYSMGCEHRNLRAKVVGGGNMFTHSQVSMRNIGKENTGKVLENLKNRNIPIEAECTGGNLGRTVRFNTQDFTAVITNKEGRKTI